MNINNNKLEIAENAKLRKSADGYQQPYINRKKLWPCKKVTFY